MSADIESDWESFDALLTAIDSKPTGLVSTLLPEVLYNAFFGPRPPDEKHISTRREQVSQTFDNFLHDYRSVCEDLSVAVKGGPPDSPYKKLNMEFEDEAIDTLSSSKSDENEDFNTHHQSLKTEIERVEKLRSDLDNLLEAQNQVYLREDEQDQLKVAEQTLNSYIDRLYDENQEAQREQFQRKLDRWQGKLETIESRMDPYLAYEKYEIEEDLEESLTRIQREIEVEKEELDSEPIPYYQVIVLEEIQHRIQELATHLQGYQIEYLNQIFSDTVEKIEKELKGLQSSLTPAKAQGRSIDRESELREQISEIRSELSDLQTYPLEDHISQSRVQTLDSLESRTAEIEKYIDAKIEFDKRINSVEAESSSLRNQASPYLNFEEYLDQPSRSRIEQRLKLATTSIQVLRQEVDLDQLSAPDQDRFAAVVQTVDEVEECLDNYNDQFVRREREKYEELFSNIGQDDLDLTPEQERAIIRNGIYNQVIAAAGTGKTLTLTTRIAYLIESQGVNPCDILVIAFTNEARDEMAERLEAHFEITNVQIETVHAFGNSIIQSEFNRNVDPIDDGQTRNLVDRFIRSARSENDERFLSHYYEFLVHFDDVYLEEADFETKEEYIQARSEQQYQTLQGEEVKSRAEKRIADILYTHQVDYRYEDIATWAETGEEKQSYEPDFYLPEYDIYIEHLGIDLAGEIGPWFSITTDEYHDKIRWAREQFAQSDATLIETYEFEHEAGNLEQVLRARLEHHNVELDRMGFEELVESAFEYNQREGWIKRKFADFIQNAKRFDVKPDRIEKALNPENPRQFHFGHCGIVLLQQYQQFLVENDLIDFSDMINRTLEFIQENPRQFQDRYDHVLVDEFQDIGKGKLELIREFVGPDSANLFAVGDDWQSIYSFQGAVVNYFLNFDEHFGTPTRTTLTDNFRSPSQIIEAGNSLITANEEQIEKEVNATKTHDTTPLVHPLEGHTDYDYVHCVCQYTLTLVQKYLREGADPDDIMILCRFDGAVPYLDEIKSKLRQASIPYSGKSDEYRGEYGDGADGVAVYSVYQAKGREANHVILVHASEGPFGFPPEGRKNELLEPVKRVEGNSVAEERRAFYVAITRSGRTLDLLTRNGQESRFLDEIEDFTQAADQSDAIEPLDDVGAEMTIVATVDHLFDDPHETKHQEGYLKDQYGRSARFVSWKNNSPQTLTQGDWYRLEGVKVDEYNGRKELVMTHRSTVENLDSPAVSDPVSGSHHASDSEHSTDEIRDYKESNQIHSSAQSTIAQNEPRPQKLPSFECKTHRYWRFVALADLYSKHHEGPTTEEG